MESKEKMKEMRSSMNARLFLIFVGVMIVANAITVTGTNGLRYLNFAGVMEELPEDAGKESVALTEAAITEEAPEAVVQEDLLTEALNSDTEDTKVEEKEETASEEIAEAAENSGTTEMDELQASGTESMELQETETELTLEEIAIRMRGMGITSQDLWLIGIVSLVAAFFEIVVGLTCVILSNRVDKYKITLKAVIALLVIEVICMVILVMKGALTIGALVYSLLMPLILLWSALKMRKMALADPTRVYAVKQNSVSRQSFKTNQAPKKSLKERAMVDTQGDDQDE